MQFKRAVFIFIFVVMSSASLVLADNWEAPIYEYGAPSHVVGVDKKKRTFNFFEKKSPFKVKYSYPCVTGQLPGDKQQVNDLRTPEGIYFVEYKIAHGLDFREYGGIAYTLNYPNPVDRLRGKTGHGIWIHSKGFDLVPTRGCVAIGREDIAEVGPLLLPGTPVVLAEELKAAKGADNGTLAQVRNLMSEWSAAWASKSPKMFDFYDPDAYSRATENFLLFRQNKERLFRILSFIRIYNREIHAIEGPGYWVTWAEQYYTASNLSTEGIRRLYWQKDGRGKFRIVGMEWTPRDVGMAAAFRKGTLVAEGPVATATDASSEAPVAPKLDMPEMSPETAAANQPAPVTQSAMATVEPLVPAPRERTNVPDEIVWGEGKRLTDPQPKKAPADPQTKSAPVIAPALKLPAAPAAAEKQPSAVEIVAEIKNLARKWRMAVQNRDTGIDDYYDRKNFNHMSADSGVPRGKSFNATIQSLKRDFRQPWIMITGREPEISVERGIARSREDLLIATPLGIRQGVQTHWWWRDATGRYRIVGSDFRPADLGLEAHYLELVSDEIASTLEEWRKAWENGNIEDYMTFYAPNASQQGRVGSANIRRQKETLWEKVKPAQVKLSGLRVSLDGSGARADMNQSYADTSGRGDKGIKTLVLRYDGKNWLIQREDWINIAQAGTAGRI